MQRRQFLINASVMLGCSIASLDVKAIEAALSFTKTASGKLAKDHIKVIETIADIIIPETDTPCASQAGVVNYIDFYLHEFFDDKKRVQFLIGLENLHQPLSKFLTLTSAEQLEVVQLLDDQLYSKKENLTYKKLKELVVIGYYTSEVGATQALKYDPVPGPYKEMKLSEVGGVWF